MVKLVLKIIQMREQIKYSGRTFSSMLKSSNQKNKWFSIGTETYYTSQDRDRQNYATDNPLRLAIFETTSKIEASISESIKF